MVNPNRQPEQTPSACEVPIETVVIDPRGRVRLYVACPFCAALHSHSGAQRFANVVLAPCRGGRYRVRADLPATGPAPRVVPCRCIPGELCLACGPDLEMLYPARIVTLAESVA
jgi:hypothetical protein